MPSFEELSTIEAWERTPDDARRGVVRRLAEALGQGFEPAIRVRRRSSGERSQGGAPRSGAPESAEAASPVMLFGRAKLPGVVHRATSLVLIAVPGGSFAMGLTDEDEDALGDVTDEGEAMNLLDEVRASARPVRAVFIRPFLIARTPILAGMLARFGEPAAEEDPRGVPPRFAAPAVARVARHFGFRLPSEAEWEWVAREGGRTSFVNGTSANDAEAGHAALHTKPFRISSARYPAANRWGVWGLPWGDWVADAWHDTYEGAPADARPWFPVEVPEIVRGNSAMSYPWETESETLLAWAGYRWRAKATDLGCVRPALDLPA
jgi:formylglycine-generating enzyme required for sulfatase activity